MFSSVIECSDVFSLYKVGSCEVVTTSLYNFASTHTCLSCCYAPLPQNEARSEIPRKRRGSQKLPKRQLTDAADKKTTSPTVRKNRNRQPTLFQQLLGVPVSTKTTPFDANLFFIIVALFFFTATCASAESTLQAHRSRRGSVMSCKSDPSPCKENMNCVPLRSGYRCECKEGYEEVGPKCEKPMEKACDDIDSKTFCYHNGTCSMKWTGFSYEKSCKCDPNKNYVGKWCEIINPSKLISNGTVEFHSDDIRNAGIVVGIVVLGFAVVLATSGRFRCLLRERAMEGIHSNNGIFYTSRDPNSDSYSNNNSRYVRGEYVPHFWPPKRQEQDVPERVPLSTLSTFITPLDIPQTSFGNFHETQTADSQC